MKKTYLFCLIPAFLLSACKGTGQWDKTSTSEEPSVSVEPKEKPTDFELPYKEDFTILNFADTQIVDSTQLRSGQTLSDSQMRLYNPKYLRIMLYSYMDELVATIKPDLITLTADNIYGKFDDTGAALRRLVEKLDSYKIPFAMTFGNHDGESAIGIKTQIDIIRSSEYAMIKDKFYTIGLYDEDGTLRRNIAMLDTNGCSQLSDQSIADGATSSLKITETQLEAMSSFANKSFDYAEAKVPTTVCQHIIPVDAYKELKDNYGLKYPFEAYKPDYEGWFGELREQPCHGETNLIPSYKAMNADTVLFSHDHINNLSFVLDGIRYTYSLKTGQYDYRNDDMLGGTTITFTDNGATATVKHNYTTANPL